MPLRTTAGGPRFLLVQIGVGLSLASLLLAESASPEPRVVGGAGGNTSFPINQPVPSSGSPVPLAVSPNVMIVDAVGAMPGGGTYRATTAAVTALRTSIRAADAQLVIDPNRATPSFCSGATYLVFLSVLGQLHRQGKIALDEATLRALLVQEHQADGSGVWGRWNANGPGTARLFYEAGLGRNFSSFDEAKPGDFMKIFWNDEIGLREAGHSVVFLGRISKPEGEFVRYWSSNQPNGFGIAEIPMQRVKRVLFSRLEHPEQIRNVLAMPARDTYLAAMLKRPSSGEEMARMVGMSDSQVIRVPVALSDSTPATNKRPTLADKAPLSSKATVAPSVAAPTPATATPAPAKDSLLKRLFRWKTPSE
ncbi:MAG: hypothetical protein WDN28_16535 [Chthoniobacter sp.]